MDFYKNKKILITGGLGFLGSNLAVRLVNSGAKVTLLDAMLPLYGGNFFNVEEIKKKIKVIVADIRDKEKVEKAVKGKDLIFHIAAQTSHIDSMTDPFLDMDINCRGNIIFLESCRKFNPEVKIIYAGTRAQYGRVEYTPADEKHPFNPTDIYGVNKTAGEQYHFIYSRICGIRVASLRINNTYGPKHQMKHALYGILNWFIRLAMDGQAIKVFGEGNQLRDFNYAQDVVAAFLKAGESKNADGKIYNLGSGKPIKFIDLVKKIVEITGSGRIEYVPWPKDRKDIETGDYVASYEKIKNELGWQPEVSLEEGLKKTVEFYRKYRKKYWKSK
jgi:UDP-glucose 4-epimerase